MVWMPSALLVLPALVDVAATVPDVAVFDGPIVANNSRTEAITIGAQPGEDIAAVEGGMAGEGYATRQRETYTVNCAVVVLAGNDDSAAARALCSQIFAAFGSALATDQTLGGLVMRAQIGQFSWWQVPGSTGVKVSVRFGVLVDAYTQEIP